MLARKLRKGQFRFSPSLKTEVVFRLRDRVLYLVLGGVTELINKMTLVSNTVAKVVRGQLFGFVENSKTTLGFGSFESKVRFWL
jgi:hypothetical protein